MQRFTDLRAWKAAHSLAVSVYKLTRVFPAEERYGLTSQLRRAAVSIGANLAEGSKRQLRVDYARFINIAEGSAAEARSLLMLVGDLGYGSRDVVESLLVSLGELTGMLHRLRLAVESADRSRTKPLAPPRARRSASANSLTPNP